MVGVVILNWNELGHTLRCLKSLQETKRSGIRTHIIVIDNGSTVDPVEEIRRDFPDIDYVRLETNVGFAAGCNLGAKRALHLGAEFLLFLNNDTIAESDFLGPMLESFSLRPDLGVVSPLIRRAERPQEIEFAGGFISYPLGRFKARRSPLPGEGLLQVCDYASGCCMLASRNALEQIGLFDENFFAYFEDSDISIRAREKGFTVGCRVDTSIAHFGSATTRSGLTHGTTSPLKHYLMARNRILLIRKHSPTSARIFFLVIMQPLIVLFYMTGFIIRYRPRKALAFLSGVRDGLLKSAVGPEIDKWQ
jgi:GT2 family glycosyltransferase